MKVGFGIGISYQYPISIQGIASPAEANFWLWNDSINCLWEDGTGILTEN